MLASGIKTRAQYLQVDFNKSVVETFDRTRGTLENLVNAVNNLQTQVETLKAEINSLKDYPEVEK